MSATRLSGTEPPPAIGTGRFWMVVKSPRASSDRRTMIGIWRSDSEKRAAFCSISPRVAIRIVCDRAAVVTPSSAAIFSRGVMMISGRLRSALIRGATSDFRPFISSTSLSAVCSSSTGSEPASITVMSRPEPNPPDCDWNRTRASGKAASLGPSSRSNSTEVRARSSLSLTKMVEDSPRRMRSSIRSTSGSLRSSAVTAFTIRLVWASVVPGTTSMVTWLFSSSMVGWNWPGIWPNSRIVTRKENQPMPSIQMRWS